MARPVAIWTIAVPGLFGIRESRPLAGQIICLVLGLLIWTAFGVFSMQKTELQVMAANALEFNQETREYGPEAAHARALMRADLDWAHKQLWGDDQAKSGGYGGFRSQHG